MKSPLLYILEVLFCSGLLLAFYRLLLVRKVSFRACRRYLVAAVFLSAVIPALDIPLYPARTVVYPLPLIAAPPAENFVQTTGELPVAVPVVPSGWRRILRPVAVGGYLTAVFLSKMAPKKLRTVMESAVSLLAGIPSVVYGLVGMLVLVPGIRKLFHVPDGASLLAAMVVLAIMILPSIIKVSINALDAVPKEYEDASLALGATPVETWFRVSAPAARSGIAAAVVLGVGCAIGEAMAVMMVSGNAPNMPSLFESVRFLTTAVASEMSYASGLQRQALFSIALVLYVFIMLINAALNFFLKRRKE